MPNNTQPDWDQIAAKFDLWLPHLAPVSETLLDALNAHAGQHIIDLASGTGEPALTLAQRLDDAADIVGVDAAPGMVRAAQAKARAGGLRGIQFLCMPAERLDFPTASFDRAMCRFGIMLLEDPELGLREMHRVVKPGGRYALAVWGRPESMTTLQWAQRAFEDRLPPDLHPPLAIATSLGDPQTLAALLRKAGYQNFDIQTHRFDYQFDSYAQYWDLLAASEILKTQLDALPEHEHRAVRDEVAGYAADFVRNGRLVIPHEYLLASGNK